jgi:phage terminase large subunit-like protein
MPQVIAWVRFWDFAATDEQKGNDPDYTANCLMGLLADGRVVVKEVWRDRISPGALEQKLIATAAADTPLVRQRWQTDPGQAGQHQTQRLRTLLRGYDAKGQTSNIPKKQRWLPLSRACEFGEVFLYQAP